MAGGSKLLPGFQSTQKACVSVCKNTCMFSPIEKNVEVLLAMLSISKGLSTSSQQALHKHTQLVFTFGPDMQNENFVQAFYGWYRGLLHHPVYRWPLIIGTVIYLISPIDISPDIFPIIGWIDDGALVGMMAAGLLQGRPKA